MINLPVDFKNDMKNILKDEYESFIDSYNFDSAKGLRLNTLKNVNVSHLPFDCTLIPWCKDGYYYKESRPGKHVYHEQGLYYIQEPSAMSVVEALNVKKGDMVLDLCAAPGGKSTQIAAKLQGEGLLVSNEIIASRARILSSNIERMGIRNCIVTNEDPNNLVKRFNGLFNKILVDAPCSGEGMFRKNPLAVNEWSELNVEMCAARQMQILETAEKMLQLNGRIVFSTCTFSDKENESVVDQFIKAHPEFEIVESGYKFSPGINTHNEDLIKCQRLYPHKLKGEGHFFAILQRGKDFESQIKLLPKKPIKQCTDFVKFMKENLNFEIEYNNLFGDNLYISPNITLDGIKVLRCGLHLGELKKNRFEPSHALCLYLKKEDFKKTIELKSNSSIVQKFLQGESIESDIKGWGAVFVDGYPLGWFKGDGMMAKNHYPKGLRKDISVDYDIY